MAENLLIVHGGGPTAVMNGSLYGAIKEAKKSDKIGHIYGANNGTGGFLKKDFLELENIPEEKLKLLLQTPGTAIGTSRDPIEQEHYEKWQIFWKKKTLNMYCLMVETEQWTLVESCIKHVRNVILT